MVVAVTLLAQGLHGQAAEANVVMAYLLALLPVALRGSAGPAIAAAVLSVLAFDFFFVPPLLTFAISDVQYLFTFAVMGLVGTAVSTLTARLAAELVESRRRERRVNALHELSRSLLAAREPGDALAEGARVLGAEIGAPVAAWLRGAGGEPLPVAAPDRALTPSEAETMRAVVREGHPAGPGTTRLPGAAWLFVPVRTAERVHGALGIPVEPADGAAAPALRAALETGANQIAVALEQARAREDAADARRVAEIERLRSTLLTAVSHDLRTPLTGIVGAAGALAEGAETLDADVRRELAEDIAAEGGRLTRLMTNLLHATRLEGGAPALDRSWYPLDELVAPVLAALRVALQGHPLAVSLPADLPMVHVDATLAGQVFANLLENAARHTPPGTAIALRASHAGGMVVVEVADAGPGLPAGDEAALFERFRRGPRPGDGGVGLGLAIVRGAVEAHGGTIAATRAPEGGACFRFTLPAPPPPAGPSDAPSGAPSDAPSGALSDAPPGALSGAPSDAPPACGPAEPPA